MQPRQCLPGHRGRWKWWQAIVSFLRQPAAERPVRRPDHITSQPQQFSGAVGTHADGLSALHRANPRDGIARANFILYGLATDAETESMSRPFSVMVSPSIRKCT